MNYLQLCQAVRNRIGLQGVGPTTVVAPTDVEADIVSAVRDAWIDIQNFRADWDWMRAVGESWSLVTGTTTYSTTDIAGPSNRVRRWVPDTLWLDDGSNKRLLYEMDYEEFEYTHKNDSGNVQPSHFTVRRSDNAIILPSPDSTYTCYIDYWKKAQDLSGNTDTPELPSHWHNLIIYLAVQKLSASIASATTQFEFGQAYAVMMGQLMREQLKKKRMKARGIA